MPIDSTHTQYDNMLKLQHKCRIVIQGEDAVKAAGQTFLHALGGQKIADYDSYKDRASFFNASGRTLAGLTGVVFRKPPKISFPEEDLLKDITIEGDEMLVFLRYVVNEVIAVGRIGLLGDPKKGKTMPRIATYQAESIINWRTETVNGVSTDILIVLEEKRMDYAEDAFKPKEVILYRVLALSNLSEEDFAKIGLNSEFELTPVVNRIGDTGNVAKSYYATALYEKEENKTNKGKPVFKLVEGPFFPTVRGQKIEFIPFVAINPTSLSLDKLENPPILDVVNVNLSHYKSSADLKHGLHFTALPTAWLAGFKADKELMIGSPTAWVSEDSNANAGYLEFTGAGLSAIRDDMKDMIEQMAILGSRLLEEPRRAVESAETQSQRKTGEESVIGSIAGTIGSGVEKVLKWFADWMLLDSDDVVTQLNKDYVSKVMDPSMMLALMSALQQGRMSFDTFGYNMQQGEIWPDGRTIEQELELIEQNPPMPGLNESAMDLEDEEEDEDEEENEDEEDEDV